jgi:AraC-like DNA-binding protein
MARKAQFMYNMAEGEMMDNFMMGYGWAKRDGISPFLSQATAITMQIKQVLVRIKLPLWILDYEFAEYGRYRVKRASALWRKREPRTGHLYPPNTILWEDTLNSSGMRNSAWIFFSMNPQADIMQIVKKNGYARFLDPDEILGQTILRCAKTGEEQGEEGFWEAQSTLCRALHLLVHSEWMGGDEYKIVAGEKGKKAPVFAGKVDNFLKQHIAEKVTLSDIARHLYVSKSLLVHRYREETNSSPIATLICMRVNYSKTLILKGFPLKTIAVQMGFSDVSHFSKTFKRVERVSPHTYMENSG